MKSSTRLAYLFQKCLDQQESDMERMELLDLMQQDALHDEVLSLMSEALQSKSGNQAPVVNNEQRGEILNSIFLASKQTFDTPRELAADTRETRKSGMFIRRWVRIAAAAVLIMAAGVYLWSESARRSSPRPFDYVESDVAPGSNRATLTLADGTTVVLDSATSGLLAQQGNMQVVKLPDGELIYRQAGGETQDTVVMNTMTTPNGGQYRLSLPDGSRVWLNAASSITYPTAFTAQRRKVKISGEAYFEVKPDKARPFEVDVADRSVIEVLGTHFNVHAYSSDGTIRTTLLEGRVRVAGLRHVAREFVTLQPGDQAVQSLDQPDIQVTADADIDRVMAWKNGLFNFEEAGLEEVLQELKRWYDIEVIFEGQIKDIRFFGELDRNVPLSVVLDALQGLGVKFRIEKGKKLIVMPSTASMRSSYENKRIFTYTDDLIRKKTGNAQTFPVTFGFI